MKKDVIEAWEVELEPDPYIIVFDYNRADLWEQGYPIEPLIQTRRIRKSKIPDFESIQDKK